MINNAIEREKNQFGEKFVEKQTRRIALNFLSQKFFSKFFLRLS